MLSPVYCVLCWAWCWPLAIVCTAEHGAGHTMCHAGPRAHVIFL